MIFTPSVSVILACLPIAYELDFGPLAQGALPHNYTIILSFRGEPDVKMPWFNNEKCTADELANHLLSSLRDPRWNLKSNGGKVIIYGYDDVRIHKVTVVGGRKPVARQIHYIPPPKKK